MSRKQLPAQGMSREAIFEALAQLRSQDLDWRTGRTFAYVYDPGREAEQIGKEAFASFLTENALDPTAFPSLLRLENELIAMTLEHLRAPEGAAGTFTSGGTESILLAVKAARERALAKDPTLEGLEMVLPVTAHAAFHKAAAYLGVEVVPVEVDPVSFRADPAAIEAAISPRTALVVVSAPSYAHGVIDPIGEVAALCQRLGVWLHVDACVGGFLLPWFRRHGVAFEDFDFQVPGVTSISMDLHKYAFTPKGASVVLYRDGALRQHQYFACARWTGYAVINPAVQSSKSGGPLASSWAVLHSLGDAGYADIAGRLVAAMRRLREGIAAIDGLRLMGDPVFCMVAFTCHGLDAFQLADLLKRRGWFVQAQHRFGALPENIHLSVHPGNLGGIEDFLRDLQEAADEARALPPVALPDGLAASLAAIDPASLDPAQVGALLAMAGASGDGLPSDMAEINHLLNVLPPALKERLLAAFLGQLFSPARAR